MIEGEDGDVYCEAANLKGDSVDSPMTCLQFVHGVCATGSSKV